MSPPPPLKLGFVGYGTIAHSIAAGLLSQPAFEVASVHVSRRSAAKSAAIEARHPGKVTVCDDNQAVVDAADLVFLCVLPALYEEVLAGLEFGERHTLVSLVSTSTLARLRECSRLPAERAFKMICLPSVATRDGTCLLVPPSPPLKAVLDTLGGCVCCATEKIMTTMMIPACLMGPYYRVLQQNRDWMVANGVPEEDASYFVGRTYLGIAKDAEASCADPKHFDALIAEQTPGGINEQSIQNLERLGAFKGYGEACDGILERLEGRGDGNRG